MKYDRVVCISLDRRPGKWEQFVKGLPSDWPFGEVERYDAYDGQRLHTPHWWRGGRGAWGCYVSHRRIIEECLNQGIESVLIFEDDAVFCDDFAEKVKAFHEALPPDAEWIYYGGQHLKQAAGQPKKISEWVYRPYNVNRTHAYGLRGQDIMRAILKHLNRKDWTTAHHIDHHFGRMHQRRDRGIYCPDQWLVDQRSGPSDVACTTKVYGHWRDASSIPPLDSLPFYAILGCHSSGSSCLAGVCYHLGVHLGNQLVGLHGKPPINGGEALGLRQLFEQTAAVPATEHRLKKEQIYHRLRKWINQRKLEAYQRDSVAAGKYPQLATAKNQLRNICGDQLHLVICERDLEESIKSLHRRMPAKPREAIAEHQEWILSCMEELRATVPEERQLIVPYTDMLADPEATVQSLIKFFGIQPTDEQVAKAVAYVDPSKRHVQAA